MTITLSPHSSELDISLHALTPASPLRSSPLAKPPWPPSAKPRQRTSADGEIKIPVPRRAPPSPGAAASNSGASGSASVASGSGTSSSPGLSRSHPLLGSYPLSLIHSRMSAHAPHSAPAFFLRLRAIASPKCPPTPQAVRAPPPLDIPFRATYYDLADGVNTPWVADVDIEGWFFEAYGGAKPRSPSFGAKDARGSPPASSSSSSTASISASTSSTAFPLTSKSGSASPPSPSSSPLAPLGPPPPYPGYRVPPVGQLQLLVRTATGPLKVFVIPYDLRSLPIGGRLLARERTYAASSSPKGGESLRYAAQLQFLCVPDGTDGSDRAFYVARTIKLVFASRAPELDAQRTERADETVPPAAIDVEDWTRVRRSHRAPVRGFSPSRERPRTPAAVASPRSLLSALDPRDEDRAATPPALGASLASALLSPTPRHFDDVPTPRPPSVASRPPSVADNRRRRGSRAERELSERLRAMEFR